MKRSTLALITAGLGILVYSLARLGLYLTYYDYFSELSFASVLTAFIQGIRFDNAVLFILLGPVCILLLLPVKYGWWRKILLWLAFGIYVASAVVLITDTAYFGFVNRHFANELFTLGNEADFILVIMKEYIFLILLAAAAILISTYFFRRLTRLPVKEEKFLWLKIFLACALVFIFIRGSFAIKPLTSIDAYRHGTIQGNLTMNGIYSTYRHRKYKNTRPEMVVTPEEAYEILGLDGDAQYPFLVEFVSQGAPKNLVLIVLESWSAYYMGVFGLSDFNVTPNFDELSENGALFLNHYAPERRSIDGLQAILTGIPPVQSLPSLGLGLEIKSSGNLGAIANENGYETVFMQTSVRRSFYMDAIAAALGFKQYYGMEDYPLVLEYDNPKASVFGWDYDAFMFLEQVLDKGDKPFLAMIFTGTTHTPFPRVPEPFNLPGANTSNEEGFLSTLAYADYALGEFIQKASSKEWFKDTIFIITADHTLGKYEKDYHFPNNYHIPLLIYSPGNIAPGKYTKVTSHLDILPTIFDITGMNASAAIAGSSVFEDSPGQALIYEGGISSIITDEGWARVSGPNIIESSFDETRQAVKERLAERAWAYQTLIYTLVSDNRWAPVN